jgi:hypothetical protein
MLIIKDFSNEDIDFSEERKLPIRVGGFHRGILQQIALSEPVNKPEFQCGRQG